MHYADEWVRFSNLVGFCEIPMEAFFQLLLQVFISHVYYFSIRPISLIQELSIMSSFFFIIYRMTNFLMPKILRRNSQEHIWTVVQRAMWPVILNSLLVYNFIAYMNLSSPQVIKLYEEKYKKTVHINFTISLPLLVLFLCSCIQVFILYKSKSLKYSRMIKLICIMLCIGMLLFLSFHVYFMYLAIISYTFKALSDYSVIVYLSILTLCDLLGAFVFAKAVFSISNFSEIWILDKVFIINMHWHGNVAIFLFVIHTIAIFLSVVLL